MPTDPNFTPAHGSLLSIIGGLMLADNLGDVHDYLNLLCDLVGIPQPEGNYLEGWTDDDWQRVGLEPNEREDDE